MATIRCDQCGQTFRNTSGRDWHMANRHLAGTERGEGGGGRAVALGQAPPVSPDAVQRIKNLEEQVAVIEDILAAISEEPAEVPETQAN